MKLVKQIGTSHNTCMTDADFLREEPPGYGGGGTAAPLAQYLRKIEGNLKRGDATEHTHRPALKELDFLAQEPVDIASAEELAKRLANLAHIIRNIITGAFLTHQASQQLRDWRDAFAATLLPELAPQAVAAKEAEAVSQFADMFAQTLAYGLFSARAMSGSGKFSRETARKLIPRTNPFLRNFFEQITGSKSSRAMERLCSRTFAAAPFWV
jgi:hypothetical protein